MEWLSILRVLIFSGIFINIIMISIVDIKYTIIPHKLNISFAVLNFSYLMLGITLEKFLSFLMMLPVIVIPVLLIIFLERKKPDGEESFGWGDRFLLLAISFGLTPDVFFVFALTMAGFSFLLVLFMLFKKKKEFSVGEFLTFSFGIAILNNLMTTLFPSLEWWQIMLTDIAYMAIYAVFVVIGMLCLKEIEIEIKGETREAKTN